ncbi:uncharacterized protein TRIADDRAFT_53707 [Trichoplax adhaerens]|uniref:PCI domain-containing protein n=1 Tax=Trichoplax adhaerens TaxID=10228 RepID=B3RPY0_TRIAD|nr:hypothetical protein TRIADDRAFT_53707 [Trichoplax adhaerens]EDV27721.1 hypothetical protein TRIADDRAFT_53707 [Trichoplax adhaerens]|eukprot:XP_002109555.1 hypothetical protein TRIADDRAFT_53707 [Trichoplax adhaerens]
MEDPYEPMQVDIQDNVDGENEKEAIISDITEMEFDALIANYEGSAKISRLIYVADHCPPFKLEALSASTNASKPIEINKKWLDTTKRSAAIKTETLENDLKSFKSNSIKESIRRGYNDLGDHQLSCGEISLSLQSFIRARDYCTSPRHIINMCISVIKTSIQQKSWTNVLSYASKAESIPELEDICKTDQYKNVKTFLNCTSGLAQLAQKRYQVAARRFLEANYEDCSFNEILTANNIAIYGGICSLVSFDRKELHSKVICSSSFKLFLQAEPVLRDIISQFYEAKYAACLSSLEKLKNGLLLDIYLSSHINTLYTMIRNKALKQYCSPYVLADLRRMAVAFNTTVPDLENELTALILDGFIDARIDSHNKVLHARDIDHRTSAFEKALSVGKDYQRRMKALMLRSIVLKNKIVVKTSSAENENNN